MTRDTYQLGKHRNDGTFVFRGALQDPPATWQMPQLQTTQQHVLQDGEYSMSLTDSVSTYHLIVLLHFLSSASSSSSNRCSDQMRNAQDTTLRASTGKHHSISNEETEQSSSKKRRRRK